MERFGATSLLDRYQAPVIEIEIAATGFAAFMAKRSGFVNPLRAFAIGRFRRVDAVWRSPLAGGNFLLGHSDGHRRRAFPNCPQGGQGGGLGWCLAFAPPLGSVRANSNRSGGRPPAISTTR